MLSLKNLGYLITYKNLFLTHLFSRPFVPPALHSLCPRPLSVNEPFTSFRVVDRTRLEACGVFRKDVARRDFKYLHLHIIYDIIVPEVNRGRDTSNRSQPRGFSRDGGGHNGEQ